MISKPCIERHNLLRSDERLSGIFKETLFPKNQEGISAKGLNWRI